MISEFEKFVVQAMINYYNYDYEMIFEYLDDNVIWYGPNYGQYIVGKENLRESLNKLTRKYEFNIENITTKMTLYTGGVHSLVITYNLFAKDENGNVKEYFQHVIINSQRCKDRNSKEFWRSPFIHISNQLIKKNDSSCVSIDSKELPCVYRNEDLNRKRLVLPGDNHVTLYIPEDSVNYIVGGKGVMCYVHTCDNTYLVHKLLKDVMAVLPPYYYRCHSSYIINLRNVIHLSSSSITLKDGTEIPISVKKYAKIKKDIDSWMLEPN